MEKLKLNPTQLAFLRKAVDVMIHPPSERQNVRLSMNYTDMSEFEKKDLERKLEKLQPKEIEV